MAVNVPAFVADVTGIFCIDIIDYVVVDGKKFRACKKCGAQI